jgi:hypothetical protein
MKVPRQCPLVLLVKVGWIGGIYEFGMKTVLLTQEIMQRKLHTLYLLKLY